MNTSRHISRSKRPTRNFSRREKIDSSSPASLIKRALISVGLTLGGTFILFFLISACILTSADPARLVTPISAILLCASALLCGFISAFKKGTPPLPAGLLSGALLCAVVLTVALFTGHKGMVLLPIVRVLLFLSVVPLSAIGAFLGGAGIPKKRYSTLRRR